MHTNDCPGEGAVDGDFPTIDATIATITLFGQTLDDLRTRLAVAELAVSFLEEEKLAMRAKLQALADSIARSSVVAPWQAQPPEPYLDEVLLALKSVVASVDRRASHH